MGESSDGIKERKRNPHAPGSNVYDASDGIKERKLNLIAYLRGVVNLDEETKHDKLDRLVLKIFPPFLVVCAVLILALVVYLHNYTVMGVVFGICLGFMLGFTVLGIACMFLSDRGVISRWYVIPAIVFIPILLSVILYPLGTNLGFSDFVVRYFDIFGASVSIYSFLVALYSVTIVVFFVAYGVVSVIVGYFRSYFYRVLRSLEVPSKSRRRRIADWLFQIPDIIDIHGVEFEPEADKGKFNVQLFMNTAFSIFVLGIVICSYIFINPLFLQIVSFDEMLLIGMFLSLFISTLVIPWSIVKSIGAKITSDAPRDFYLWKGMKGRLYQGFFAITFFMMLLTLSVYLGMDLSRIVTTYIGYIAFVALISIITSFVYVNTYYKGFKNGIIKSYMRSKEE
ncbi:hypothetical protein Mpt1_c04880 [Candidatus Methanoplasma termitum]|uniref:Uncharacterized protein n=1 Tax=Candidatus Methanoplasma termitum TaxID=1577791 RepID=A0A0A7LB42_9ARCH|nr:hypothetical protein [Candidatus Methanoplasma termitum]AIZ56380.1 hypothetical protein Mpt1_c04880 [Candidatus Methanoplasma termitum]